MSEFNLTASIAATTLPQRSTEQMQATARNAQNQGDKTEIRKIAEDFEAVYIGEMLNTMWSGLETDGMFGGGHAEQMFRGMMLSEQAKTMASNGGIGIADSVEAELLRLQEVQK